MKKQEIIIQDIGRKPYKEVWDIQTSFFKSLTAIKLHNRDHSDKLDYENRLIVCEHPPVYTIGRNGKIENKLFDEERLNAIGAEFYKINRGGDITFHGEGQLVVYPIFDLDDFITDIDKFFRQLEQIVINTIAHFGVKGYRIKGCTGVWVMNRKLNIPEKICAMGIRCSRWITMHGIAINVNTDLKYFENIIPCGLQDKGVTSIQKIIGEKVDFEVFKTLFLEELSKEFNKKLVSK